MLAYDWSKFSTGINANADIKDIYAAWPTRAELQQSFLRTAKFTNPDNVIRGNQDGIAKGDSYRWL